MMVITMIKKIKRVSCFSVLLSIVLIVVSSKNILAIEKIKCSSQLFINNEEVELGSTIEEVKENDIFEIKLTITYTGNPVNAIITFPKMDGVEIDMNEPIYIDGKATELRNITTQIHNGTEISMKLNYIGNTEDIIPRIHIQIVGEGQYAFAFKYQSMVSKVDSSQIVVRSYGIDGSLLFYENIEKGQNVNLPEYNLIGYKVIGFNNRKDGSGTFYQGEKIYRNTDFYAVCEAKEYKVYYYVNDEIYKEDMVVFGEKIKAYQPPQLQGKEFLYWIGTVDDENDIIYVYAVYKNQKSDTYYFNGKDLSQEELEELLEDFTIHFSKVAESDKSLGKNKYKNSNVNIRIDAAGNVTLEGSNSKNISKSLQQKSEFILFISLLLVSTITIAKKIKMNRRKKKWEDKNEG